MPTLAIIAAILLLLLIPLFAKVRIILTYHGAILLRIRYLFFTFTLHPRKKKPKKKKMKKKKSAVKKPNGSGAPGTGNATQKKKREPLTLGDIRLLIRLFRQTIGRILDKASRHIRIELRELSVSVGGEPDAAKAAIEYGLLSQAVTYFVAFLENTRFLKPPKPRAIDLRVNFLEREHRFSFRADLSCPLIFLFPFLIFSLTEALKLKGRFTKRRTARSNTAKTAPKENRNG